MTDKELALRYAPIVHFDQNETIPLVAVGYTVFRETKRSRSFPKRIVEVPQDAGLVIEYAYYWDYDIDHMYDLEHIWVTVDKKGTLVYAEASFHGAYLKLLVPELKGAVPPTNEHVHAFCQPGKHAFLPDGDFFRVIPMWYECCNQQAGGPVLIGGPFSENFTADKKNVFTPTDEDNRNSTRYLKEYKAFEPTLVFTVDMPSDVKYISWDEMYELIPQRISKECTRLHELYKGV